MESASICLTLGTVLLTKPSDNLSMQFVKSMKKKADGEPDVGAPYRIITCISPAAVATSVGAASGANVSAGKTVLGVTGAQSESALLIQGEDASSHFTATASFYNCLNFAAGMYDEATATEIQKSIFEGAIKLQSGGTKSPADSSDGYLVSGTVSGLTGKGLVLLNYYSSSSAGEEVEVPPGGKTATSFKFSKKVANGSIYAVIVKSPPIGQECHTTANSAGVIAADVTNVSIACK
jgi:hypothetical protein